ncbi:MAG: methionyl-tRNA formyltransferase [Propionicimonas sp.]
MRLVFAGTPIVAARTLAHLLQRSDHEVVAVISRPDAPLGRSKRPVPSPVAELAIERGIEILRPDRPGEPETMARLAELAPDACPVIAYGALLPQRVLEIPAHGWLNVHYSLLPRWRGAAPVQRAILAGDEVTGVSVFRLVQAMDAGPVFATAEIQIAAGETAGELLERLTPIGAELLVETLDQIAGGDAVAIEQPEDGVTIAPKLTVEDARLDWSAPAVELARVVRACNPSPMAWTTYAGERFRVLRAEAAGTVPTVPSPEVSTGSTRGGQRPGFISAGRREVLVGTGAGALRLLEVQPQGKRPMPAAAWANGLRGEHGALE